MKRKTGFISTQAGLGFILLTVREGDDWVEYILSSEQLNWLIMRPRLSWTFVRIFANNDQRAGRGRHWNLKDFQRGVKLAGFLLLNLALSQCLTPFDKIHWLMVYWGLRLYQNPNLRKVISPLSNPTPTLNMKSTFSSEPPATNPPNISKYWWWYICKS